MPAWNDYKASAKQRGSLALELYVVESTPCVEPQALQTILPDHLEYQKEMEAQGKLFLAGPVSDPTGEQMEGQGMIVYRAASMDEARSIADNDPMHAKGTRSYTLRKWLVNEGALSLTIALSSQSVGVE